MTWLEAYPEDQEPTAEAIATFIHNPLWEELNDYLQSPAYSAIPKLSFSGCSGQPGWNIKYAKGGKGLCTLYPMDGFYIALVVVGEKERTEMEMLLPSFTSSIQSIYASAGALMGAKWLMIPVTAADVLADVKRLISLRRPPKISQ